MIGRMAAIATAVMADAIRRKVLYVVVFVGLVMAGAIPSLPSFDVGVVAGLYREIVLAVGFVAALAVSLSLTATRIPGEVEKRTVYSLLSRGVPRWEYLVGSWLGVFATMAWVVAAFTVIAQAIGVVTYQDPMWILWQGALGIWLEMGVLAALAIAVSSRVSAIPVVLASLTFLFAGHSRGYLLAGAESLAWDLYPSLDAFNVINPVAHGSGVSAAYLTTMALVFVAYSALFLVVGALAFRGRDL